MIFDKLSSDQDVSAGSVVVRGTRMNFQTLAMASIDEGMSNDEIRETYGDHFDDEAINQCCVLFAYCRRNLGDFALLPD